MLFREFITESLPVFLLEYNREKTLENWKEKLEKRFKEDSRYREKDNLSVILNSILMELENADPTSNKQYVQWLIKAYINGSELEDLYSRGKDNLEKFEILKKKKLIKPEHADIGRFKNLSALENAMEQYEIPEDENVDKGDSTEIENNEEFRAIIPHNETAACYYGQGTRWCTAAKNDNMFKRYHDEGDLIIIIPKEPEYKGEKYQIHNGPFVVMNERDERITKANFRKRFKTLNYKKLFDKTIYGKTEGAFKDRLKRGTLTPKQAFAYADEVIKGPWPEGEKIIAKDPYHSYLYAHSVLKDRFPESEEVVAKSDFAYTYAMNVIKGPWPEGEKMIKKNPYFWSEYQNLVSAVKGNK